MLQLKHISATSTMMPTFGTNYLLTNITLLAEATTNPQLYSLKIFLGSDKSFTPFMDDKIVVPREKHDVLERIILVLQNRLSNCQIIEQNKPLDNCSFKMK